MTQIPTPDLRIIPASAPRPHEQHDSQRSKPLIQTLRQAEFITNPPIVTHTDDDLYIILDGANRCYAFTELGIPHILVQVVSYFSGQVTLETWNHVVSRWSEYTFLEQLQALPDVEVTPGLDKNAIAHVHFTNGDIVALNAPVQSTHERNAALRAVVGIYQKQAVLNRTPLVEPSDVWELFPEAVALVVFPGYEPGDIIEATRHQAYLPPGISRHIVQGRALSVNYPMQKLKDASQSLNDKNQQLKAWISDQLLHRRVRFYAESTYQFSE